jgi:hypothetical protein
MRIETVINSPRDLRCHARLPHLGDLQDKARGDCNFDGVTPETEETPDD